MREVEIIKSQGHGAHGGKATEQYYGRGGSNLTATVVMEVIQQGDSTHSTVTLLNNFHHNSGC